ncbi:MAG: DNA primase [Lachnospiraceae bacterium]|nr:DNA primase [Lachnospiraceae bacterium]HCJ08730.1 DNA primase [Lachnospiraceae bacterium]
MYYSDEIIEEVRSRNDIVDVISSYVNLKKKGNSYSACCPFHHEKTPSFHVSREKQMYHCFGCGVGGNVYTFLMEHENYSFPEAVEALAERAGIKLPEQSMSPEAKKQADERSRIKDMNRLAAGYFHYLLRTDHGKHAMEYLTGRGLTEETINKFALGFSDVYRDDLYKYLKSKGYKDEELKNSGLVKFDEKYGASDQFWNRVMYPIVDTNNRVIGFGGRVMGDGKPKYINTQETLVFDKSRNLYGLNLAKKSRRSGIIFCEGYMDVISMHQAGFDNAVASLGTALTPGQVNLIKRYTDHVYLAYDSDEAGTKAALRALGIMREFEMPARVISLKPYKDPDELIQAEGTESFERRIEQAQSGTMFEIGILEHNYNQEDPQERTQFQKEAAKRLCQINDPLERNNYVESVAKQYGIDKDSLKETVTQYGIAGAGKIDTSVFRERTPRKSPEEEKQQKQLKSERLLITWLINDNSLFDKLKGIVTPEDFLDPVYHDVIKELMEQYERDGTVTPAAIMNHYQSKEEHEKISGIMQQDFDMEVAQSEKSKVITDLVKSIRHRSLQHQLEEAKGDLARTGQLMMDKAMIDRLQIHI